MKKKKAGRSVTHKGLLEASVMPSHRVFSRTLMAAIQEHRLCSSRCPRNTNESVPLIMGSRIKDHLSVKKKTWTAHLKKKNRNQI